MTTKDSCNTCYNLLKKYGLDCPKNCDYDTAKIALRKLYLKYHPDKGGNPEIFREIRECGEMIIKDKCTDTYNIRTICDIMTQKLRKTYTVKPICIKYRSPKNKDTKLSDCSTGSYKRKGYVVQEKCKIFSSEEKKAADDYAKKQQLKKEEQEYIFKQVAYMGRADDGDTFIEEGKFIKKISNKPFPPRSDFYLLDIDPNWYQHYVSALEDFKRNGFYNILVKIPAPDNERKYIEEAEIRYKKDMELWEEEEKQRAKKREKNEKYRKLWKKENTEIQDKQWKIFLKSKEGVGADENEDDSNWHWLQFLKNTTNYFNREKNGVFKPFLPPEDEKECKEYNEWEDEDDYKREPSIWYESYYGKIPRKKSRVPCKSHQERNPETGRCRNKSSAPKSLRKSSPKKRSGKSSSRKPCNPNQVRNRSTQRCRNKSTKKSRSKKSPTKKSPKKSRSKKSSTKKSPKKSRSKISRKTPTKKTKRKI